MNAKTIVTQQLEAMKAMKERIKKYGYLLPEEDKNYLMEKVEESLRKCQIYVDMETIIEEAGLEPKPEPKKFTPPTRPTIITPPPAKKKADEPEQLSLMAGQNAGRQGHRGGNQGSENKNCRTGKNHGTYR